jgi:hypothetical protein
METKHTPGLENPFPAREWAQHGDWQRGFDGRPMFGQPGSICADAYAAGRFARLEILTIELVTALLPFATIGSGFDMEDVQRARAVIAKATGATP